MLISAIFFSPLAHAVSETTAQNKVFIYEPYLISQLAELISPEKQVDYVSFFLKKIEKRGVYIYIHI